MTSNDISLYTNKYRLIDHYFAQASTEKLLPAEEKKIKSHHQILYKNERTWNTHT